MANVCYFFLLLIFLLHHFHPSTAKDKRKIVKNANQLPYSSIGLILTLTTSVPRKAKTKHPNLKYWPGQCTGTLISRTHILTSAHCIANVATGKIKYDPSVIQIRVYRRMNTEFTDFVKHYSDNTDGFISFLDERDEYGYIKVEQIFKANGYKTYWGPIGIIYPEHLVPFDYAVLKLNRIYSSPNNIMQFIYDNELREGQKLYSAGYPGSKSGKKLYKMYSSPFVINKLKISDPDKSMGSWIQPRNRNERKNAGFLKGTALDYAGGQSGSPVWKEMEYGSIKHYQQVGIFSGVWRHPTTLRVYSTQTTRITKGVAIEICKWMKIGTEEIIWRQQIVCNNLENNGHLLEEVSVYWRFDVFHWIILSICLFVIICAAIGCFLGYIVAVISYKKY